VIEHGRRERIELAINWLVVFLAFCLPTFRRGVTVGASLLIILWLFHGSWKKKGRVFVRIAPILAVAVFFALNFLSLLWTQNLGDGLVYVSKYRYFFLIPAIATTLRPKFREHAIVAFLTGYVLSLI
jgi:hypothetical protein